MYSKIKNKTTHFGSKGSTLDHQTALVRLALAHSHAFICTPHLTRSFTGSLNDTRESVISIKKMNN